LLKSDVLLSPHLYIFIFLYTIESLLIALVIVHLEGCDYNKCLFFSLAKIKEWIDKNDEGATIIPFSGELEEKVSLAVFLLLNC